MNQFRRYALGVALLALFFVGCDSTSPDDDATPPALLPAEAFALQTSLFSQQDAGKTNAGPHFTAAALRVWPVSVIISANLVIPVLVTAAALEADPIQNGNTWIWSSTVVDDGNEVTFTLSGTVSGSVIAWSMRVSFTEGQQVFNNFELYTASTDLSSNTGTWQLYYLLDGERRNVLNADFAVPSDTEARITYSVPASAEDNAGDSVRYEADGNDRIFDWREVSPARTHLILWDAPTKAGSITATNYNNGEESCWDGDLENTACAN